MLSVFLLNVILLSVIMLSVPNAILLGVIMLSVPNAILLGVIMLSVMAAFEWPSSQIVIATFFCHFSFTAKKYHYRHYSFSAPFSISSRGTNWLGDPRSTSCLSRLETCDALESFISTSYREVRCVIIQNVV
jgi:hypothetical protein